MKKYKRLVLGGIESKVVSLVLAAMLLVSVVFMVFLQQQSRMLSRLAEETSARQQASMAGITTGVIDTVIEENMSRITELEAKVTDELFRDVEVQVRMMGDYAGKLLADPDSVPRVWKTIIPSNAPTGPKSAAIRREASDILKLPLLALALSIP